jgi:nitroreductase
MATFKPFVFQSLSTDEQRHRAHQFRMLMGSRRSIRHFSPRPVAREVIEEVVQTAASAPSGANKQPWTFVVVTDPSLKKEIRLAAEKEERESYEHRMSEEWLKDLEPLGTDWHKEFLEIAPALIVVFAQSYAKEGDAVQKHYYVRESVGIASGILIAALHNAGLVSLTHTPSPMDFLGRILGRPENEKAFLLIPVGYPADDARVPDISRKPLSEVLVWR